MLCGSLGLLRSAAGGDPYYANVVVLLHMNGVNAGTTFTDQKGHTFTANGNVQTSTTSPKFGASSAVFDGTADWIDTPDSTDFTLGTGDWTVECWLKTTSNNLEVFGQADSAASGGSTSIFMYIPPSGILRAGGNVLTSQKAVDTTVVVNDGVWHHVACVCASGVIKAFVDGVSTGGTVVTGGAINDSPYKFTVGRYGEYPGLTFSGSIDEFRLTKGVARYTTNFTPPTAAFPDN